MGPGDKARPLPRALSLTTCLVPYPALACSPVPGAGTSAQAAEPDTVVQVGYWGRRAGSGEGPRSGEGEGGPRLCVHTCVHTPWTLGVGAERTADACVS
jgi:hypothetical protein